MNAKERLMGILNGIERGRMCGCPVCSDIARDAKTIALAEGIRFIADVLEESYGLGLVIEELENEQDDSFCSEQTLGEFRDSMYASGINQIAIDVNRHVAQLDAATDDCSSLCSELDIDVLVDCDTLLDYPLCLFLRSLHVAGVKEFVLDCARGREGKV